MEPIREEVWSISERTKGGDKWSQENPIRKLDEISPFIKIQTRLTIGTEKDRA